MNASRAVCDLVQVSMPRVQLLGPEPLIESLHWRDAATDKPDADETVLLWTGCDDYPYELGHWDDEFWIADAHGGPLASVTHWARVEGPAA